MARDLVVSFLDSFDIENSCKTYSKMAFGGGIFPLGGCAMQSLLLP